MSRENPTPEEIRFNLSVHKHYPVGMVVTLWAIFADMRQYLSKAEIAILDRMDTDRDLLMNSIKKRTYKTKKRKK